MSQVQKNLLTWSLTIIAAWLTAKSLSYFGGLISLLLTAGLIAFLLNYPVTALKSILPQRALAAAVVYLVSLILVSILLVTLIPPVIEQARQLIINFPSFVGLAQQRLTNLQSWSEEHNLPIDVQLLTAQFSGRFQFLAESTARTSVNLLLGTFDRFIDFILILVISFYMLIDGQKLWLWLTSIFSPLIQTELTAALKRNLHQFLTGQLLLGTFMAITLTLAFWVLRVPFFLLFAVFIGVMELIPFIGATLGIGIVVIIVLFIDPWLALKVLVTSVIVQQIKDNLITPKLMGNLTGLSPIFIFISLLIGAEVAGLLGVVLAIPLTGVIKSLAEVIGDPVLPPQTGSFFQNPLKKPDLRPKILTNQKEYDNDLS
ncbi:AI-2E family transporter [Aphanothece hegewaldii]|uniref:AI-2E family transporter n=1 Tax=Aphanothece hegewaldii TaxID=1521625 RepID=UPI001FE2DDC0|nr:AI-2E family transporter [Aphanothece hegewaldii]